MSPPMVLAEFREWHRQIQATHHIRFFTDAADPANPGRVRSDYETFRSALNNLVLGIIQAKKRLIDAIPPAAAPGAAQPQPATANP